MGYVTANQGRPIQGISQQPHKVRVNGQCSESINWRPDIVKGLITRPGTQLISKISETGYDINTKWHYYDRGTGEEYFFAIDENGAISAWTPDGVEGVVTADAPATAYLNTTVPKDELEMVTIGDTTFIANKKTPVVSSTTLTPSQTFEGIVYVQFTDYGQTQKVFVENILTDTRTEVASYSAPDGSAASQSDQIATTYVAQQLYDDMIVNAVIMAEYNVTLEENTIFISRQDGLDFKLDSSDDADGKNCIVVKGSIDDTSQLPPRAPEGFLIEIDPPGANTTDNANYYLRTEEDNRGGIKWVETVAPDIPVGMDKTTMPVQLVRTSIISGVPQFHLELGSWEDRTVGDERTNPLPSFVDTPGVFIETMGIFQNRLFFTAGESVVLTRSSEFYFFFRETSQAALETDPIDIFADATQVNVLTSSVPFDGDLVFFSSEAQFVLSGQEAVSSENATLRQTTAFEADQGVRPVASGENIFFPFKFGRFTGVREYYTDSIVDTKRARPVTDHVNQLIIGRPNLFKSSTALNLLLTRTDEDLNLLYVYEWLWQGTEKVQSAWGKWEFEEGSIIHDVQFNDTDLYLIISRGEGTYIEKIDVGDADDLNVDYSIRLDRKVELDFTYDPSGKWVATDPYLGSDIIGVESLGCYQVGNEVYLERDGLGNIFTEDDIADPLDVTVKVYVGIPYDAIYEPTQPVAKDSQGGAMDLDRLTVGAYFVTYDKTGDIEATVTKRDGGSRTANFGNRTIGGPENLVGLAPQVEGQHRIPIRAKSNKYTLSLRTMDHRPTAIRDFQWNGTFNPRGRRIG